MKIKTITTHDVYNYGASLQAYALMKYLEQCGHEVEIIDYKPNYILRRYDYRWVNPESAFHRYMITRIIYRVLKYIQRQTTMARKNRFDRYTHQFLKTTRTYHSNDELKENPPSADIYIVGSDQIWNSFYDNGKDPAFYLDFAPQDTKRVSYAASFSIMKIDKQHTKFVQKLLTQFDAISVREYHALKILEDLSIDHGTWVLDPVFLLPTADWNQLVLPFTKKEKYILIYDFEKNKLIQAYAKMLSKHTGMKIYSINDTYPLLYADKNINSAGPLEFITYIKNCDYFISNSFHGTAFSILFQKDFCVFNRMRHNVNSRMESLLTMFDLKDQLIKSTSDFKQMYFSIDYSDVNTKLNKYIIESKRYLKKAIINSDSTDLL